MCEPVDGRTRVFETIEDLARAEGEHLGVGPWLELTETRVRTYLAATRREELRTDADGREPTGHPTTAPSLLILSLLPLLGRGIFQLRERRLGLNQGVGKARFLRDVAVGARIRADATLTSVVLRPNGCRATLSYAVEVEGEESPACEAEMILVYFA